jgi:serine protease Do
MATAIHPSVGRAPLLDDTTAALAAYLGPRVVEVRSGERGAGSGVIWGSDGLIVTNAHVVRAPNMEVVLADGATLPATVAARDDAHDLAALRVAATGLPTAALGDSDSLRVGQVVLAMGNPLGLTRALTMGIVHALGTGDRGRWIQADIRLAPGNSGGPLVDAEGKVIGINSMIAGGLALAVPSSLVTRFLAGDTRPAYLGVRVQGVRLPGAEGTQCLLVLETIDGGAAARGGLLPGDLLLTAGRTTLHDPRDLPSTLRDLTPGTPLPLTILRAGLRREITIVLGESPTDAG